MQKIILSFLMVSIVMAVGCKSGGGDPKVTLINFFDALAKKDMTAVKKYTTKDSEAMLNMVQMGMQNLPADKSSELMGARENMDIGEAVIAGDKATVPVKDKKTGEATDFTLKKEDGSWKVAFDKSTLMEMAQKKMKEHGLNGMGNMQKGMNDSLNNLNNPSNNMDSVSNEDMLKARKMMDSANKMLNDAKNNPK